MSELLTAQRVEFAELSRLLSEYEHKYKISTVEFFRRYSAGDLGDDDEMMMWAGIYHLYLSSVPVRQFVRDGVNAAI